jgi:hypothetical protein
MGCVLKRGFRGVAAAIAAILAASACSSTSDVSEIAVVEGSPPPQDSRSSGDDVVTDEADETALLLELGSTLADAARAGGPSLARALLVTAADREAVSDDCAPEWAHELLSVPHGAEFVAEATDGQLHVGPVAIPAEVQLQRAVHSSVPCEGPLPTADAGSPDPEPSPLAGARPAGASPTPDAPGSADRTTAPVDSAPQDRVPAESAPAGRAPTAAASPVDHRLDAHGQTLPEHMVLPRASVTYRCAWQSDGTLRFDWTVHLSGGREYGYVNNTNAEAGGNRVDGFMAQMRSKSRSPSTLPGFGEDRQAMTRTSLPIPPQPELALIHHGGPQHESEPGRFYTPSGQVQVDYHNLNCAGRDPRPGRRPT